MPTPTQDPMADNGATDADGAALYDSIMADIEPELIHANLPKMAPLLANDTPDQRKARAIRYSAAFEEYEKRFKERNADWAARFKTFKCSAMQTMEKEIQSQDQADFSTLESTILSPRQS